MIHSIRTRPLIAGAFLLAAATTALAADPFSADVPDMLEQAQAAGLDQVYDGPWEYFVGGGAAAFAFAFVLAGFFLLGVAACGAGAATVSV